MKKLISLLIIIFAATALFGCNNNKNIDQNRGNEINIAALKGPTMMGLAKLNEDSKNKITSNSYNFFMESALDPITTMLSRNEIDAASIPSNAAAILYNKAGLDISVAAINTLGVLFVVENKNTSAITALGDLKGKSVMMTGQGAVPQYTFEHLLREHNIGSKDITIQYKTETAEVLSELTAGKIDIAVLPQPFVTSALKTNSNLRVALDINEEWNKIESLRDCPPITAVLVVRNSYLKHNKTKFDKFLDEYKTSVEYMTAPENLDAAAQLVVDLSILPKLPIAKEALPKCNITFIEGNEMQTKLTAFFDILYNAASQSIGGKMPVEKFYYKR